jgi:hypothetical protein
MDNRLSLSRIESAHAQPRPLAALGYLANGSVTDGLIDVEKLTLVILHDELIRPGHCVLRLAGYSGCRVPWGVRFGGPEQNLFFKDLGLQRLPEARGCHLDLTSTELLALDLGLERELHRCARYRQRQVRQHVQLPDLWAAFRPADAATITGDGPELAACAARTGRSPQNLLEHLRRDHLSLVLYPLAWVSHRWQQAVAVFADLERFPTRQVFRLRQPADDLVGFRGAVAFDFYGSRFKRTDAAHHAPAAPLRSLRYELWVGCEGIFAR